LYPAYPGVFRCLPLTALTDLNDFFLIVKPSCVFIRKIDINGCRSAFLRVVDGLLHISSPFSDLSEKWLARMPYKQRSLPGP